MDEEVIEPGLELLIRAMRGIVILQTTPEAKELFRQYCKNTGSLARQRGWSMHHSAVRSVMFCSNQSSFVETKNGRYIFWGGPHEFHELEFRIRCKTSAYRNPERYPEAMSTVIDGLM